MQIKKGDLRLRMEYFILGKGLQGNLEGDIYVILWKSI
jgi:hypothetical protein